MELSVELQGIKGFALMTDWDRAWHSYYAAAENQLRRMVTLQSDQLVANSSGQSLDSIVWFFERFGWDNAPLSTLKQDQEAFLSGRR